MLFHGTLPPKILYGTPMYDANVRSCVEEAGGHSYFLKEGVFFLCPFM